MYGVFKVFPDSTLPNVFNMINTKFYFCSSVNGFGVMHFLNT